MLATPVVSDQCWYARDALKLVIEQCVVHSHSKAKKVVISLSYCLNNGWFLAFHHLGRFVCREGGGAVNVLSRTFVNFLHKGHVDGGS